MKSYFSQVPIVNKRRIQVKLSSIFEFLLLAILSINLNGQTGLMAEFYDGSNFDRLITTRITNNINMSWHKTPPVPGIDPEKCSIRWSGRIQAPITGEYEFSARVDDGIRVWVDDQLIIDDWELNDLGVFAGKAKMEADKFYDLKVEYFNALIEGEIRLLWTIPEKDKRWYTSLFTTVDPKIIDAKYFFQPIPKKAPQIENIVADVSNSPIPSSGPQKSIEGVVNKKKKVTPASRVIIKEEVPDKVTPTKELPRSMQPEEVTPEIIKMFTPESVQFDRAQADILPSSFEQLDLLAAFLSKNSYLKVRIEGHTDIAGDPEKNMALSERRAYAVARYLVQKGVRANTIDAIGLGGSKPLIRSANKVYHPENRRVAFAISIP